jgi:proteasome lid subunit RPN8/RPN11
MLSISSQVGQDIMAHALVGYQQDRRETCGLVISVDGAQMYFPCRNMAEGAAGRDTFKIDPRDMVDAETLGEVLAIVHSHPDASAHATDADRWMCERTGLPWIIISMPDGVILQIEPTGRRLPLVGRQFHHGLVDCYTLIQDYYAEAVGIELPHFERTDDWWSRGEDLYRANFQAAGFVQVGTPDTVQLRQHDVLLMMVAAKQENHGAVMVDPVAGIILQHLWGRLSGRDVYGGYWLRHTTAVLRHSSMLEHAA